MQRNPNVPIKKIVLTVGVQAEAESIIRSLRMREVEDFVELGFDERPDFRLYVSTINAEPIYLVSHYVQLDKYSVDEERVQQTTDLIIKKLKPDAIVNVGLAGGLQGTNIGETFLVTDFTLSDFSNFYPATLASMANPLLGFKSTVCLTESLLADIQDKATLFGIKIKDKDATIMAEALEKTSIHFFSIKVVGYKITSNHFPQQDYVNNYNATTHILAEQTRSFIYFLSRKPAYLLGLDLEDYNLEQICLACQQVILTHSSRGQSGKFFENHNFNIIDDLRNINKIIDDIYQSKDSDLKKITKMFKYLYSLSFESEKFLPFYHDLFNAIFPANAPRKAM